MSIPKIIHYCWFGGEMSDKEKECIETWKKFFPDYEIKRWDETNFDVGACKFSKEAYELKEYAFVSDYVRTKVLFEEGGVYFDTDVKVLKPFEITNNTFGFERRYLLGTAVVVAEQYNPVMREWMEYYENHNFRLKDGSLDRGVNAQVITDMMQRKGLKLGGEKQTAGGFEILNREVFYPKKLDDENFRITDETVAIHMASNTWMSEREKRRGQNKLWINVARPVLRAGRKISNKLLGKDKSRYVEIKLRDKMK